MTDKKQEEEVKGYKAEGTLAVFVLDEILNNPHRPNDVFKWNEDKILGLGESIISQGLWYNVEFTVDKWGKVYIAGGGHHRIETVRRLVAEGRGPEIRGLFKNDEGKWCLKGVKKKYTRDQMLKMFMLENADAWGKDSNENVCMMIVQVRSYLQKVLDEADDVEDFIEKVKSPNELAMDERAFTRAKNKGIGASTIHQWLGENTWSRQAIQDGVAALTQPGPEGEALAKLAEKLPNVTMANRFRLLMTQEQDGEKVLSAEEDQNKAAKLIEKEVLSRADLEKADKLKKEQDLSPLAALNEVVKGKTEAKKAAAADTAGKGKGTDQKLIKPAEATLISLKNLRGSLKLMASEKDGWSKKQKAQAKDLFKDIAGDMKLQLK